MPVYLDNNATTRPFEAVIEAQAHASRLAWMNSSSPHILGRDAKLHLMNAKKQISRALGCSPGELIFTSGATESNNLAVAGCFDAEQYRRNPRKKLLISSIEHPSVLEAAEALRKKGAIVEHLPVDREGRIVLSALKSAIGPDVLLVSVMAANNEVGTLQDISAIAAICHEAGAFMHTDATQWMGRALINLRSWSVDLLSASSHKLHGPKGIGILYVKRGTPVEGQIYGGGHQGGLRSGTADVPSVVGFAKAVELIPDHDTWKRVAQLREDLFNGLQMKLSKISRNSPLNNCLPNTLNVCFEGADSEAIMASAPEICCSPGSACSHAVPKPSHVLLAMGLDQNKASQSLRFSLSYMTTRAEIDQTIVAISAAVLYVRQEMEMAA